MKGIVFDQLPAFKEWLRIKLEMDKLPPTATIAVVDGNEIKAVVGYTNYNGVDVHMMVAGDGKWCKPEFLPVFFGYPFLQGGCSRVTSLIKEGNKSSRKLCQHLGFIEEGRLRKYYGDGSDCIVYGLLKEDCKYIEDSGDGVKTG